MLISKALPNKLFTTRFHCFLLSLNRKYCYYYYYAAIVFGEILWREEDSETYFFYSFWEQNKEGNTYLNIHCFFGIDNISGFSRTTTSSETTTLLKIVETFLL